MNVLFIIAFSFLGQAFDLSDFTNKDVSVALKEALNKSVKESVSQLGVQDGFWSNDAVKIPLPENLKSVESMARRFGLNEPFDEIHLKINRAAEGAVSQAGPILLDSLKKMTLQDAKKIITGSDTAATEYFKSTSKDKLREKFLPIVKKVTAQVKLVETYNRWAGKLSQFGLSSEATSLDNYVTSKALDGLFVVISDKEKAIRKDPVQQGSEMVKKVFGSILNK